MAPIIPVLISIVTSLPKLITSWKLLKPAYDKVAEVATAETDPSKSKKEINLEKHAEVLEYMKTFLLPTVNKKWGWNEDDMDTVIKFLVLIYNKIKKRKEKRTISA